MLDGGAGGLILLGLKRANKRAAQAELEHGQDNEPNAKTFKDFENTCFGDMQSPRLERLGWDIAGR